VATRNSQIVSKRHEGRIPDSWHHQMIFGISEAGVFLCNPIECVTYDELLPQLCSPSELLITREDIVGRKKPRTDLRLLVRHPDPRWNEMNVLGEIMMGCHSTV